MKRHRALWAIAILAILLPRSVAADATAPRPMPLRLDVPAVHLAWNAPWGAPRAAEGVTADCADSTGADTLYLTFESPKNLMPLTGISGALLFEPQAGDTLDRFWFVERGGANAGNLLVDFDLVNTEEANSPWQVLVAGAVGYAHTGGRGRLDLSADVPVAKALPLVPRTKYYFARVTIHRKGGVLAGCRVPTRITWVGGCFRTSRTGSERLAFAMGSGQSVTWNAARTGVTPRRTGMKLETYIPRFAPPSHEVLDRRTAMEHTPQGTGDFEK